jgi:hypothetical protein
VRRHELDLLSLIAGLLLLAAGAASLAGADVLDLDLRWLWPSLAIFVGLIVLVTLRAGRD